MQLKGDIRTVGELGDFCEGMKTNAQGGRTISYGGTALDSTHSLNPCGLLAHLYPMDIFTLTYDNSTVIPLQTTDLSLDGLKGNKFKAPTNAKDIQWIDVESDRFINWMQNPVGISFQILWGKFNYSIPKGK